MIFKLVIAFIISIILIGTAWGQTSADLYFVYNMEQKVEGNGFFNSHQNITSGNLLLGNHGHGSGSYNYESVLYSQNRARFNNESGEYELVNDHSVKFNESVDYAYAPIKMRLGKSFNSGAFQTLGKEDLCIKNYGSNVSMNARFDSLETLSKDLYANMYWKRVTSSDELLGSSDEATATTTLNVDAAFTGRGHIGFLEVNNSVHNVNKMIDEDYVGTYSLVKKMTHEYKYKMSVTTDSWLPCCFGGWNDMYYFDKKYYGSSAKGVFDCTCFKAPTQAQFPRVYTP